MPALAAAAVAALLLIFGGAGVFADFTGDDLMNMYGSWREPVSRHLTDIVLFFRPSPTFRPVGALFYRLFFEAFGFHALHFRLACFALLLANLGLAYVVVWRLTGSRETGALAALLMAYHGQFWILYISTGNCYDLFCFFFYMAALAYYLGARERESPLAWRRVAVWSGLYILCLDSKEMAVSLPVVIAAYELLAHPPERQRWVSWLWREGRVPAVGAVLTAAFIFGRVVGPQGLASIGAYRPAIQVSVYLARAGRFLTMALYHPRWLTPAVAGAFLALLLAAAVLSRSAPLRLSVIWMLAGILPVAFIDPRGLDAVYIPALALTLCLAIGIRAAAGRTHSAAVFAGVLVALACAHYKYGRVDFETLTEPNRRIRAVYEQLRERRPFPKDSRILFLLDPIPDANWNSAFLVYLSSRDPSLRVDRADWLRDRPAEIRDFDIVLSWERDRLVECDAAPFQGVSTRELAGCGCPPPRAPVYHGL